MPDNPLNGSICVALNDAATALGRVYRKLLTPHNLTYTQLMVLHAIEELDEPQVRQLSELLDLATSTLSPLLKRLEQNGLITRIRCPADERVVTVSLTSAGRDKLVNVRGIPHEVAKAAGLDVDALKMAHKVLQSIKLNANTYLDTQEPEI